jgi:hypothetical protein
MRRIPTVAFSALMLASCASPYDRSAMPKAAARLQRDTVGCNIKWTAKEFETYSEWQTCQLTAERGFARAIALTKMDAFEVYAADLQKLAADRDAHRVTDRQVRSRANDIHRRFLADCGCRPSRGPLVTANSAAFGGAGPFGGSGSTLGPYAGDNIQSGNPAHPENIPRPN